MYALHVLVPSRHANADTGLPQLHYLRQRYTHELVRMRVGVLQHAQHTTLCA